MTTDTTWQSVRERCESLDPDEVLVTPGDERVFVVERTDADRIVVRFIDGGSQDLRRDQFDVLAESVDDEGLELTSPARRRAVRHRPQSGLAVRRRGGGSRSQDTQRVDADDTPVESPFVRSRWDVRRPPEEVHDDALLVADFSNGTTSPPSPSCRPRTWSTCTSLVSDVQWAPTNSDATSVATCWTRWAPTAVARPVRDGVSNTAGAPHPERRRRGARRTGRGRRPARVGPRRRSGQTRRGAGHDRGRRGDVYDTHEQYYVQKTGTESDAKRLAVAGIERQAGRNRKTKRPRSYTRR